jgi:hypothetical protein
MDINQKEDFDSFENRRASRQARIKARRSQRGERLAGNWIFGGVLVFLGVVFFLQNFGWFAFQNWGALFLLIPAFGAFARVWQITKTTGNIFPNALTALIFGTAMTALAFLLLFEVDLTYFGPALLILIGLALFINAFSDK